MTKLNEKTLNELNKDLESKNISAVELTNDIYAEIEKKEKDIQAFLLLTKENALKQAKNIDDRRAKGEKLSPLAGIPGAIKDNINILGLETTCASKILKGFKAPFNATVIEKLNAAGAVYIGKTNMDEFAMGSSTENSAFQKTKNPRNLECVPGGSSGGSAAAVAANMAIFSLGSDTGGSIRQPAAFCGVVGLKPTYGRVSRFGLVAFASSLDQIGPFTKDVRDNAIVFNAISGFDKQDSTSANIETPDFTKSLGESVAGLKIGLVKELMGDGIDPEIKQKILSAAQALEKQGAKIVEVEMPSFKHALSVYYLVATAEASANLSRFDGVRFGHRAKEAEDIYTMFKKSRSQGFGPEVKRRIMLGTYALSSGYYDAYYLKAQKVRTLIKQDFAKAYQKCDVLFTPTTPTVAFKFGEKTNDPLSMYLSDIATIPINLAGVPALAMPCGTSKGLPVGLQIIGREFDEATIFKAAFAVEQSLGK